MNWSLHISNILIFSFHTVRRHVFKSQNRSWFWHVYCMASLLYRTLFIFMVSRESVLCWHFLCFLQRITITPQSINEVPDNVILLIFLLEPKLMMIMSILCWFSKRLYWTKGYLYIGHTYICLGIQFCIFYIWMGTYAFTFSCAWRNGRECFVQINPNWSKIEIFCMNGPVALLFFSYKLQYGNLLHVRLKIFYATYTRYWFEIDLGKEDDEIKMLKSFRVLKHSAYGT